jgi:hypothetical protein
MERSIMDMLSMFEELVLNGSVEVEGKDVVLTRGSEINIKIYEEDGYVVIKFGSPPIQIRVTKLGPKKLINALRPTLEEVHMHKDRFTIMSDNCPDLEVER